MQLPLRLQAFNIASPVQTKLFGSTPVHSIKSGSVFLSKSWQEALVTQLLAFELIKSPNIVI